jgi:hypothetical protein
MTTTYSTRPGAIRSGRFTSDELIGSALHNLDEAMLAQRPNEAYAAAYLAAIRAAAAVLAISAKPAARKPTSVWVLLTKHAPQYREWADFFTACSKKSAACQLGLRDIVTQRETDDFLRDASSFVDLVADQLGVTRQLKLSTNSLCAEVSGSATR